MNPTEASTPLMEQTLESCRRQQCGWAQLPVRQRLRPMRALRRLLVEERDPLCAAVNRDIGKTVEETLATDMLPSADALRWLERHAASVLRPRRVPLRQRPLWLFGQSDTVHRRPRGVMGLISTWNYPVFLAVVPLAQALVAGNGVLWKPSELAAGSAAIVFDLLQRAGFPQDLVQLLPATREAGAELVSLDIDHVCFTGSAAVGRALASNLGQRLISSTLELSGCDAMFVLADADIPLAVRAAWFGATVNRGQTCLAVRRALVQRPVYSAFEDALRPLAAAASPVPLATEKQVRHAERLVREALGDGARPLNNSMSDNGAANVFRPSVVLDARPEMALCREDSFAPLLAVLPFDSVDEALRLNAVCHYGLGASIFTRNLNLAERMAAQVRAGVVTVNETVVPTGHPATPFGGVGQSGWGVTQGLEGLLEMTVPQVVSVSGGTFRQHYELAAGRQAHQERLLLGLLDLTHGPTLGRRWRGLVRTVRALWSGSTPGG